MNSGCLSLLDPQLWPHITVSARSWGLSHHEAHGLLSFVSSLSDALSILSDIYLLVYLLFVYLCVCMHVYTLNLPCRLWGSNIRLDLKRVYPLTHLASLFGFLFAVLWCWGSTSGS